VHTVDVVVVCVAVVVVLLFSAVLARQRYMLRAAGAIPLALQRGNRWVYGIGRYDGGELRIYRALGWGTRPTRTLHRGQVQVLNRRGPTPTERRALPRSAVVVACRNGRETVAFALEPSAFTGFVSWLESSAPL
jgi:hypothetical protein